MTTIFRCPYGTRQQQYIMSRSAILAAMLEHLIIWRIAGLCPPSP
jgi:hypothetical protein